MITDFAIALVEDINSRLDAQSVLDTINFHADKVQQAGETLKAFCPVHKDSRFRSALVDGEHKAFRCTVKTCPGYSGGTLVDLYALSTDKPVLQAACELVDALQVTMEDNWRITLSDSYMESANAAWQRADYTEVETLLRELISISPRAAEPRLMLAALQHELGNSQEAAEEYVRVIDDCLTDDRKQDAIRYVNDALNRFPQNEDIRFASIRVADASGNRDLAISRMQEIMAIREAENRQMDNIGLLEQLVEMAPDRPDFAINLGELYEQQHNVRGASRQYENAANFYAQTNQNSKAVEWLEKVVQFNAENNRARMQLVELLLQIGDVNKARDHTFRVINQHIDQQEFGPAVTILNRWLEQEPGSISSRELLARVYLEQERIPEAAAYLVEGASMSAEAGDHATAADLLLRAKYLTPDATDLRRQLIAEFTALGEQQKAAFESIDLAEILFTSGNDEAATALLTEGVSSDISISLKLQMIGALSSHGQENFARTTLNEILPSVQSAPVDVQIEFFEMQSRLMPSHVESHLALVETLWQIAPERAADAAADSAAILLKHDHAEGAVRVIEAISTRLDGFLLESVRLMQLAGQAGRPDIAGTIYQYNIQGLADYDPQRALNTARWMWEVDPQHPSAASDIAYLLATLGETAEAAAQYALVAELLYALGDFDAGYQYASEALNLEPSNLRALAANALLACRVLPPEDADVALQNLLTQLPSASDGESAAAAYLAAIELQPENEKLLQQASNALLTFDRKEAASRVQARHAALIGGRGDWAGATEKLAIAVETSSAIPEIWEQYGEAAKITSDNETAAIAFSEAALAYHKQDNIDSAQRCLSSAALTQPTTPAAREKLFTAAQALGATETANFMVALLTNHFAAAGPPALAVRWAREWVRLAPESAWSHSALGSALASIDQSEAAAQSLSLAAGIYFASRDIDAAIKALEFPVKKGIVFDQDIDLLQAAVNQLKPDTDNSRQSIRLLGSALIHRSEIPAAAAIAEKADATLGVELWPQIARLSKDPVLAVKAWIKSAEAATAAGKPSDAIAFLHEGLAIHDSVELHRVAADYLVGQTQLDLALPHFIRVIIHAASRNDDQLASIFQKTRKLYSDNAEALSHLAQPLLDAKRQDLALVNLEQAATVALATNDTTALIQICGMDEELTRSSVVLTRARADALMGAENEQQALEWVADSARKLASEGNFAEAREMADRWMNLRSKDVEARKLFALACEKTGRQEEADSTNLRTAEILLAANDPVASAELLDQLLIRAPGNMRALRLLIEAQKRSSNVGAATASLCRLAEMLEAAGDIEAALATYTQCVALDSSVTTAIWKQAELTRQVEDDRAALPIYRHWLHARQSIVDNNQWIGDLKSVAAIMPDSSGVLRDLTLALTEAGRPAEAQPYLESLCDILEAEGDFNAAANALESLIAHAAPPRADKHLEAARLYEKGNASSLAQDHLRNAADILEHEGNIEQATAAMDKIIQIAGENTLAEDYAYAATLHARAANKSRARALIQQALQTLSSQTGNRDRREKLLAQAVSIDPLDPSFVIQHLEYLPAGRAMAEGMRAAEAMQAAGKHDDAIQILTQVVALAPHDMSVRQQLFAPLRAAGNKMRLRQELMLLASDALAAGDSDAAIEALDEAETLAETAQQFRALAELNERARRLDEATAQFVKAATVFASAGKTEQAVASINRAMTAKPSAIPTETMADLVGLLGDAVYDIAREQLRSALTARRQKQSQILALALMTASPDRANEVLKTVYTLGGSSILAGIAHRRVNALIEQDDVPAALTLVTGLLETAPDSSDVWHLYAQVSNAAGNRNDAVRAAMEAARLYAIAGAVIEEEDAYGQAIEADSEDLIVRNAFAEFLIREHRPDEAVEQFQIIVEQARLAGNQDAQLESLNRAVQIAPANTDLREMLARALENIAPDSAIDNWLHTAASYREAGQQDKAVRTWQHVLSLNPRNETALQQLMLAARENADLPMAATLTQRLADVKAARKNIGEACRLLQAHLEIDPDNLEILEQLSTFAGASNDNEVFMATTRALARRTQKIGDNEAALRHYEALLARSPRDTALLSTILDCCAASGNAEKGITYARQLLNIARETEDPERIRVAAATIINFEESDADARRELAESLLSLNRVTEAVTEFLRTAEFYEASGSNSNAFNCYRRVTQISPGSAQAWRRLADLSLTIGDMETARRSVSQVMETASRADATRIRPLIDRLLQTSEDVTDIHKFARDFYRRIGDDASAATESARLAQIAAAAGENELAETHFTEALQSDPANAEIKTAHYTFIRQVGRLEELQLRLREEVDRHMAAGNTEQALNTFKELAAVAPTQVAIHRDLALMLENENRHDEALQEFLTVIRLLLERSELEDARDVAEKVVERFPDNTNAWELVADVLVESAYPDLAARYYSHAAESATAAGDNNCAIALLQKTIKARPLWAGAHSALASAYERDGQTEKAFQATIELITVLMDNGEFLEATSTLTKLSKAHPESPQVLEQLAGLYEKTGRREDFIKVLRELADIYEKDRDQAKAAATLHRLTQAAPDDAEAIARYVELATSIGESGEKFADEYTRLADVLARTGDAEGAFQAYEQVLSQSPENTSARSRYAAFLLSRGSRNRALSEMRTLANLYLQRQDPAAAAEVLNAAMTISPRDAELCLELAKAQESAGMIEDARVSYARASAILANTAAVKGIDTYRRILSIDENNTAVRLRLVELLMKAGDTMEAAREARTLAEIHINRGELAEAEHAYSLVDQCEPQSITEIRAAIQRDSYDPSLQYLHYVRLGNCLFNAGDIDNALDAYRTARSLHDDQVELIQKCIDCLALIAPEAEAILDYLVMAEKYLLAGQMQQARQAYEKVRLIDPFNNDARGGLESVNAAEKQQAASSGMGMQDNLVLKTSRSVNKRIALMDLLLACQDAADEQPSSDSNRLGLGKLN